MTNEIELREIPEAIRDLLSQYNSEDCTDEQRLEIEIRLEELDLEFTSFIESLCTSVAEQEANAEMYAPEIIRLSKKKDTCLARAGRLSTFIDHLLRRRGVEKIKAGLFDLSFRKSEAVVITDEKLLSGDYVRTKIEADRTKIKSAIKKGIVIEGAFIEERKNLQIK